MRKPFDLLFVLGPSGVGKSDFVKYLKSHHDWLHLEIDLPTGDGIDANGLRPEWDAFYQSESPLDLAAELRKRIAQAGKRKCVLSFSSGLVLSPKHIAAGANYSIKIVYLYGPAPLCIMSFLKREQETGRNLPIEHWLKNNQTYLRMSCPEFQQQRVDVFNADDTRRPLEEVLHEIEES